MNAQNKTVVELKTLTKIDDSNKSKSRSITFKLIFEDTFLILSTQNTNNMNEWIRLIRKSVALPAPKPTPLLPVVEGIFLLRFQLYFLEFHFLPGFLYIPYFFYIPYFVHLTTRRQESEILTQ